MGVKVIRLSGSIGKLCIYDLEETAFQNQRTRSLEFYDESLRLWRWEAFSVPIAPLKEQKRIAAEIEKQFSRLDQAVENLQRVKANYSKGYQTV